MILYSGLPRSGTNLLKNILAQNNNIQVSHESVVCTIVNSVFASAKKYNNEYNYNENLEELESTIKNFIKGGTQQIDSDYKKIHINHNKYWSEYLPKMITLGYKVIFSVRNISDILCSFEHQKQKHLSFDTTLNLNCQNPLIGRLEQHEIFGFFQSGISFLNDVSMDLDKYKDNLLIVRYEDFVNHPKEILDKIYSFLNIDAFEHDFNNININGYNDMRVGERLGISHDVRPKLDTFVKKYSVDPDVKKYFSKKYHSVLKLLGYT